MLRSVRGGGPLHAALPAREVWSVERWRVMGDKSPKNNQKQQSQKKAATSKKTVDPAKK